MRFRSEKIEVVGVEQAYNRIGGIILVGGKNDNRIHTAFYPRTIFDYIGGVVNVENVVAVATAHEVGTSTTVEGVVTRIARENVIFITGPDIIVAVATVESISTGASFTRTGNATVGGPATTDDEVVAFTTRYFIITLASVDHIQTVTSVEGVVAVFPVEVVIAVTTVDRVVTGSVGNSAEGGAITAKEEVIASATINGVVIPLTVESVVTNITGEGILTETAEDIVVTATTIDEVGAVLTTAVI